MGVINKLQAVNRMLRAASELPVNSLDTSGVSDADVAIAILEEQNIALQLEGKSWNTETVTLVPDADQKIAVSSNVLSLIPVNEWDRRDLVIRGGYVYDQEDNRNTFPDDLEGIDFQKVVLLPFNDIPTSSQLMVANAAAREYQARVMGDQQVDNNLAIYEIQAAIRANREEAKRRKGSWIFSKRSSTARSIHDRDTQY